MIIHMRIFIFIVFMIVFIARQFSGNVQPKQAVSAAESPPTVEEVMQTFTSSQEATGSFFSESDIRSLTDSDIMALTEIDGWSMESLTQLAINEIQARHNYLFKS